MRESSCGGHVDSRIFAKNSSRNYQRKYFDILLTAKCANANMVGAPPYKRYRIEPRVARGGENLLSVLIREILVGVLFNALVFPYLIWLVNLKPPATLGGPDGVVGSLAKATVFAVSLMTVILTMVWRKKAGRGTVPLVGSAVLVWSRFTPRNIVGRALFFALLALATLAPIGVAVCFLFGLYPMTKLGFAVFNVCYGAVIGTVVTPFVTLVAIGDCQTAAR
jgi:hypothetical protein